MYPPIYPPVAASSACRALLKAGQSELRFYQFGKAPQNVQKPYAVWQRVYGQPYNHMNEVPNTDSFTVQVDCYASPAAINPNGADQVRNVAAAIRDAIEPVAYITNWLGESIDPDTQNFKFSFQTDWITTR